MTFKLEINCDNDAFRPMPHNEIISCLAYVIECLQESSEVLPDGPIIDSNGNRVGQYAFKGKQPK